ncbi:hypothetical protein O0L34_g14879 [Tuta absoluta]|nr:hypothetical protein O0L34_g14879 [Tuta absoluta]
MWRSCLILLVFVWVNVTAKVNESTWEEVVLRNRRQAGDQKCTLPPYPDNGRYSVGGNSKVRPGDQVNSAQLHVSCNPGYKASGNNILYCVLGAWSEELPKCVRFCKLNPHPSVKYRCQATSEDSEDSYYRDCNTQEPTGTIVRPQCNEPNYYFAGVLSHMRCNEGRWNHIAICQPECGTVTPDGKGLIIDGRESKQGEFPWHAGIYRKDNNKFLLICGGSLVSNSVVISAAHCFWDKVENKVRPVSSYAVALGKFYRGWSNPLDEKVQKFEVGNIKVPPRYGGADSNFQEDIAIVWLSKPAVYAPHVRPVCLDFEPYFDAFQLRDGNVGKVAGWGIKDLEGKPSPVLKVIELPYVKIEQCIEESPPTFRPFITSDKICAGYTNGSALCQGDSGGGLVFMARDRGAERYYLRGIVSTAPESQEACNAFARTSFTKVTKHKDFIEKNTVAVDQTSAIQQESDALCILPPYPKEGSYVMLGSPAARPGQGYYTAYLDVTCNKGFMLERVTTPSCTYGRWTEDIPKCIPIRTDRCLLPKDWNSYQCLDDNDTAKRPCKEFETNGTVAFRICSQSNANIFHKPIISDEIAVCVNGIWEGDLDCKTYCGSVTLPGGSELPWVTAVYLKKSQKYICGGTLVNSKYVITAAHCVSNRQGVPQDPQKYLIAAGKLYPAYEDARDEHAQISEVSEIIFPENRDITRYEKDIALLGLTQRLSLNTYVQPACFDATYNVNNPQLKGAVARSGSWRLTNSARETSYEKALLVPVSLQIYDKAMCLNALHQIYQPFLTADKICARDIVGQGICQGDSGLGLVYPVKGRYVLLGVVSVGLSEVSCSADQPTGFSSVYPTGEL